MNCDVKDMIHPPPQNKTKTKQKHMHCAVVLILHVPRIKGAVAGESDDARDGFSFLPTAAGWKAGVRNDFSLQKIHRHSIALRRFSEGASACVTCVCVYACV